MAQLVAPGKVCLLGAAAPAVEEVHALVAARVVEAVVELALAAAAEVRACEEGPGVAVVVACRVIS